MRRGSALFVLVACTRTFTGQAVQPNPIEHPTDTLRSSERITIVTGDMDLYAPRAINSAYQAAPAIGQRWPLLNQASFTVLSRDRLRFHIQIDHKWQEWADLTRWSVTLIDDRGRRWSPESIDHPRVAMITRMWDRELQNAICDVDSRGVPQIDANGDCLAPPRYGPTTDLESGYLNPMTLGSLTVFRGKADFEFYQRNIMSADVRWLKLVVKHGEIVFEFVWRFEDSVAAAD